MKIQINSLEALERLIGGDTQVEIEIRNSIVQEFTKKYLKALVNETIASEVIKEALRQARNSLMSELFTTDNTHFLYPKTTLKKEITDKFILELKGSLYKDIYEELNLPEVKKQLLATAEYAKNEALNKYTNEQVYKEITEKIRKELVSKL